MSERRAVPIKPGRKKKTVAKKAVRKSRNGVRPSGGVAKKTPRYKPKVVRSAGEEHTDESSSRDYFNTDDEFLDYLGKDGRSFWRKVIDWIKG